MSRIVDVEPLDCLAWKDGEHGTTFDDGVLWVLEKIGELPAVQTCEDAVSRQAAIERATKDHDFFKGATIPTDKARRDELLNVMCWLRELPSAQPEVVYCKKCKHWTRTCGDEQWGLGDCDVFDKHLVMCNGYCAWAERRTDE